MMIKQKKKIMKYPSKYKDGEYSIIICFNRFTTSEIMSNNNKIECQQCTEQKEESKRLHKNPNLNLY